MTIDAMNLGRIVRETPLPSELGGATAETALSGAEDSNPQRVEAPQLSKGGDKPSPTLICDVVAADCAELRDIAEWFESRGKPMQGEFLRMVADRHEGIFGAYWAATINESSVVA